MTSIHVQHSLLTSTKGRRYLRVASGSEIPRGISLAALRKRQKSSSFHFARETRYLRYCRDKIGLPPRLCAIVAEISENSSSEISARCVVRAGRTHFYEKRRYESRDRRDLGLERELLRSNDFIRNRAKCVIIEIQECLMSRIQLSISLLKTLTVTKSIFKFSSNYALSLYIVS